jgi:hypothetical protein
VAQPFAASPLPALPTAIAITGALLTSIAYVTVRSLAEHENPMVIVFYFPLVSLPMSLPLVVVNPVLPSGSDWAWLIGVGIFTLVMIFFICELLDDEDKKEREQRKYYKSQFSNKHISKSEFSQRKGVGSQYIKPSPNSTESLNTSSQKIVEANEVISSKPMNGNINCKCGYGDSHRNFLPSDAGDLFKKCPKCNSHIQVLSPSSTLGPHKCINCGYPGVAGAFFASSAGSHYLECPKCNTHFEK